MSERVECPYCDKDYANRSGLHKHLKNHHLEEQSFSEPEDSEPTELHLTETVEETGDDEWIEPETEEVEPEETDAGGWMDYTGGLETTDEATDHIPTVLKFQANSPSAKMDRKTRRKIDHSILMAGYGGADLVLSKYANAVTGGEIKEVRHSQSDKSFTANLTLAWMDEQGYTLSDKISTGMLAAGANAMYIGGPIVRIQKRATKNPLKHIGRKFSLRKLWPFGRKKRKQQATVVPLSTPEEGESNE